ncbi:hypothetical protein SAMN05216223_13148 [Actinacidiphila yanglinensis]|uniref:Glycosyl transferase family 2 n=1 Tax=Actinacidiphila yanglinensis TaxID=310779 RepID=A0A1H6EC67_9ACTN|nr:hypothetical protein [Actinacidiphila yanglinensis]SEG94863.1 hypothetical protein SAMN05216223_13148 [Actinacidiphila yanglinensis]
MTTPRTAAAILPSRNEPATIAAVTTAVDTALDDPQAVIVHTDSSDDPATARHFAATPTRARKISLTGVPRGKGTQILNALAHLPGGTGPVLIADTDTRNPDPAVYRALLNLARTSGGCATANYPRYWDEANLTSHLARPLIAATTGHDIPQPLAGDLALPARAVRAALRADLELAPDLAAAVDGYGIDAFLLLTGARTGPLSSVTLPTPKQHAASFPHLQQIYDQAVPILLALTTHQPQPRAAEALPAARYRPAERQVTPDRLASMHAVLDKLAPAQAGYDAPPWPLPVADAWQAVRSGTPPDQAARTLWPAYVDRVRTWLTAPPCGGRAADLAAAHARLVTALTSRTARSHTP